MYVIVCIIVPCESGKNFNIIVLLYLMWCCRACHVKHPLSTLNLTLSSICIVTFSYMKLLNYCMEWANYVQQLPLSSQFLMISMHL